MPAPTVTVVPSSLRSLRLKRPLCFLPFLLKTILCLRPCPTQNKRHPMAHGYNNRQSEQLSDSSPQILINRWWRQVNRPFALWCGYFGLIGSKSGCIFRTSCRQQKERDLFFLRELPFFITATCILEGTVCLRSRSGDGGGIGADRGGRKGTASGKEKREK